jgi:IS30 family transposase
MEVVNAMTKFQKDKIAVLRKNGISYADVAEALGIGVNTIKSYCLRNNLGTANQENAQSRPRCEQCKKMLKKSCQPSRRFCSDACRMAWWKAHPKKLNRKAVYHFTCHVCHEPFSAYGNANRKFCSRACYGKSKAVAK